MILLTDNKNELTGAGQLIQKQNIIAVNLLTSIITRLKDSEEKLEVNKKNILNEAEKLAKKDPGRINESMLNHLKVEIKKRNIK